MINDQLLAYIKDQTARGLSREVISSNLKSTGWAEGDIAEAFTAISVPSPSISSAPSAPAVSYIPLTTAPVEVKTNSHGNSKKIGIILLILGLAGALGAGGYAYYTKTSPSLDNLVLDVAETLRDNTSATTDITFNVDFSLFSEGTQGLELLTGDISIPSELTLTSRGSGDTSDPENMKIQAVISLDFGPLSMEAEYKLIDDVFYAKLSKIPTLGFLPDTSLYENKWFSYDLSGIPEFADSKTKLTEEQEEHMYQILRGSHIANEVKKLPMEIVEGESSYHYLFELDREGFVSYLNKVIEYLHSINQDPSLQTLDPKVLAEGLEKVQNFSGEVWIGRDSKIPHKLVMNFDIVPEKDKPEEKFKIRATIILRDWNKPVNITAPGEVTSFEELLGSFGVPTTPTTIELPTVPY